MKKYRFELMPNVFLTVLETNKFKTNCLSLNILRPLCREEAAMNTLLPDVLLRGCRMCPDMGAISAWLDERYGSGVQATARKKGEVQAIGFFMDYINDKYVPENENLTADICRLMGSFLLEPVLEKGAFCRDYVTGERLNLINTVMSQINDKRLYAAVQLRRIMFEGERYGVDQYGTREEIEAITPESLYAHYRNILETSQIEIMFAGETDFENLKKSLLEALRALPRGECTQVTTERGPWPKSVRTVTETMDVTQGKLVMGFRTGITAGDTDYPAMCLLNSVYGGGLTSKLFMNVRERLGLCYYASSGLDRMKGTMIVSSGVDSDQYETAMNEILNQLDACRNGDITETEIESARKYLISELKTNGDSLYAMEGFYLGQTIGGFDDTPEELAAKIAGVSIPELQKAAAKIKLDTVYFLKGAD